MFSYNIHKSMYLPSDAHKKCKRLEGGESRLRAFYCVTIEHIKPVEYLVFNAPLSQPDSVIINFDDGVAKIHFF